MWLPRGAGRRSVAGVLESWSALGRCAWDSKVGTTCTHAATSERDSDQPLTSWSSTHRRCVDVTVLNFEFWRACSRREAVVGGKQRLYLFPK